MSKLVVGNRETAFEVSFRESGVKTEYRPEWQMTTESAEVELW